jgi:hypothetical protein
MAQIRQSELGNSVILRTGRWRRSQPMRPLQAISKSRTPSDRSDPAKQGLQRGLRLDLFPQLVPITARETDVGKESRLADFVQARLRGHAW